MTADEIKALLLSGEEEGADRATIYDKVIDEFIALGKKVDEITASGKENEDKITSLVNKVAELTDNNFKLLDKIKYQSAPEVQNQVPENDPASVTIADLFSNNKEA